MTTRTYETARRHVCPAGHKHPHHNRPLVAFVPDGSGLAPECVVCRAAMVPAGPELNGSWTLSACCTPAGPGGRWAGPPRDPRKCIWCFGTKLSVDCTICSASGCDGVHDFCLECDGEKRVTCPGCEGDGVTDVDDEASDPCPACKGDGNVRCPACNGTGKPGRQQLAAAAARARRGPEPAPATRPAATAQGSAAPAMPGASIGEAHRTVAGQAERLEAVATGSEQLENDLLAGGLEADDATLSKVRSAAHLTSSAAQAWRAVDAGLDGHAAGVAYAGSGIAAKTSFLQG